jgi:hypothetical protein
MKKRVLIIINVLTFIFLLYLWLIHFRESKIKCEVGPIKCSIIKTDCYGSSRNHPKAIISYNNTKYTVSTGKDCFNLKLGEDNEHFFYDNFLKRVFFIDSDTLQGIYVAIVLCGLFLIFWFVPKKYW